MRRSFTMSADETIGAHMLPGSRSFQRADPRANVRAADPALAKQPGGAWAPVFLTVIATEGNVKEACKAAGVSRQVAYRRRERDASFRAAWDAAIEAAVDELERVARQRA